MKSISKCLRMATVTGLLVIAGTAVANSSSLMIFNGNAPGAGLSCYAYNNSSSDVPFSQTCSNGVRGLQQQGAGAQVTLPGFGDSISFLGTGMTQLVTFTTDGYRTTVTATGGLQVAAGTQQGSSITFNNSYQAVNVYITSPSSKATN